MWPIFKTIKSCKLFVYLNLSLTVMIHTKLCYITRIRHYVTMYKFSKICVKTNISFPLTLLKNIDSLINISMIIW